MNTREPGERNAVGHKHARFKCSVEATAEVSRRGNQWQASSSDKCKSLPEKAHRTNLVAALDRLGKSWIIRARKGSALRGGGTDCMPTV
jgi:hypothetical protein